MTETKNLKTNTQWPCGEKIVTVRTMTDKEMKNEGWQRNYHESFNPTCFVLSDGSVIYPSRDFEGNGPGLFFGIKDSSNFTITLSEA